jgi:hypothetical protein
MAWYNDWGYRKKITITGQSGAGTDYQTKLLIGATSSASGENFDLAGHSADFPAAKGDGGDLVFTSADGTTVLDFWVESVSGSGDTSLATVWIEVKDSLETNKDIYCYYGKVSATNLSNGIDTFIVFDDFDGASLDSGIWSTYQIDSSSQTSSILTTSATNKDPNKIIMDVDGTGPSGNNVCLRTLMRATVGVNADQRSGVSIKTGATGEGYNFVMHDYSAFGDGGKFLDDGIVWGTNRIVGFAKNTWYIFEIYHDGTNVKARRSGDDTWHSWTISSRAGYPALNNGGYLERSDCDWEWALARKCIATEPSYASADSEEVIVSSRTSFPMFTFFRI